MTEPEPDATELSARNKESEDVTLLTERDRAAPASVVDVDEDDVTLFSSRSGAPAAGVAEVADADTADQTRLSRRSGEAAPVVRSPRGGHTLAPLPPGMIGGAIAERGTFGQPAKEYEARELPVAPVPVPHADPARPAPAEPGPDLERGRSRREAARHRRLITAAIVVGVTAAIMTAAVIGIIALVRSGA